MKLKLSLSAFAVALAVCGPAFAGDAENQLVVDAIMLANSGASPDGTFNATWDGVGSPDAARYPFGSTGGRFSGSAWTSGVTTGHCAFHGIVCDGSGNMVNLEVPNAMMTMTAAEFFAALAPVAGDLLTVNYSNTGGVADDNAVSGAMPADLSAFTSLLVFAVNNAGTGGTLPDMSAMSNLEFAGLDDSSFTGMSGQIGGSALETLNINNNPSMAGDLTSTLSASANSLVRIRASGTPLQGQIPDYSANTVLNFFEVDQTGLGGVLNLNAAASGLEGSGNFNVTNTGITAGTGTSTGPYSPAVAAATLNSAVPDTTDGTIDVTWTEPTPAADGYLIQVSSDSGVTWTEVADTTGAMGTTSALTAGTYNVRVVAYDSQNNGSINYDIEAVPSNEQTGVTVTISGGTTTGGTTTGGTTTGGTTTGGTTTGGSSSGGGAAWLLLALPLLALRRRNG
ncbi:MAG: hypothetical protein AAF460_13380 [Pseudomonadota bacterium]